MGSLERYDQRNFRYSENLDLLENGERNPKPRPRHPGYSIMHVLCSFGDTAIKSIEQALKHKPDLTSVTDDDNRSPVLHMVPSGSYFLTEISDLWSSKYKSNQCTT